MKRKIIIIALMCVILFQFISCEKNEIDIHIKNTDREITFFSQEMDRVKLNLQITIEDNEKEEKIHLTEFCYNEVTKITIDDLPGGEYFSNNAKIKNVSYEIDNSLTAFWIMFIAFALCFTLLVLFYVLPKKGKVQIRDT